MDLLKKYFDGNSLFIFVSDYAKSYFNVVNEKPMTSVLAPITFTLFCYYVYIYIRKFYPICVNCWFCNAFFNVPFEDQFEFVCIECGQFNGFKEDGSYTKTIPEQHDQRYNNTVFNILQSDIKESKNGLCHKCNIIQEMKVKQLASFTPINENNFDREVEKFKKSLEETLKLCSKCNLFAKKMLSLQEQRYNLKSIQMNNQMDLQDICIDWPNICSLFLSLIVFLLSTSANNFLSVWATKYADTSIFLKSYMTVAHSIGIISFGGLLCEVYQCLKTMNKLNAIIMLLWSSLFAINSFEILDRFKPKLLLSVSIVSLSSVTLLKSLIKKPKLRQTSIQLENEKYKFSTANYADMSANGSIKNSPEPEMMDIDYIDESPKTVKKTIHNKTVNNLFQGMKLSDNHSIKNNVIRPSKLFMPARYDKFTGYAESSSGYYPPYSVKDDYEFDTQSMCSQHNYRTHFSQLCHQPSYTCYTPYQHHQSSSSNPLNLSHSSNTSVRQNESDWPKMLIYSIPGIILLGLQCYLLYDIKDSMKQK